VLQNFIVEVLSLNDGLPILGGGLLLLVIEVLKFMEEISGLIISFRGSMKTLRATGPTLIAPSGTGFMLKAGTVTEKPLSCLFTFV
jgi:hypothetical protein